MIKQRCRINSTTYSVSERYRFREGTIIGEDKTTYKILWDAAKSPSAYGKAFIEIIGTIEDDSIATMTDVNAVELLLKLRKEYLEFWLRKAPWSPEIKANVETTIEALDRGIVRLGGRKALDAAKQI